MPYDYYDSYSESEQDEYSEYLRSVEEEIEALHNFMKDSRSKRLKESYLKNKPHRLTNIFK